MSRVEQINSLLRQELAQLISREISAPNFLITLCHLECSPDLKIAKIGVSVLPEKFSGTALKKLRNKTNFFSKELNKKIKLRNIPKLKWLIDDTEKKASELEEILDKIKKGEI